MRKVPLGTADPIDAAVASWREVATSRSVRGEPLPTRRIDERATQLTRLVWEPLQIEADRVLIAARIQGPTWDRARIEDLIAARVAVAVLILHRNRDRRLAPISVRDVDKRTTQDMSFYKDFMSMNVSNSHRRLVFLLIFALGLSACAGKDKKEETADAMTEQFRQEILTTVTDPKRAKKAANLADQLRQLFADAERQYKKDFETFRSLNANFDTKETAFQGFFMNMNNQARARQKRVLEIHAKMQELLTAQEWEDLEKAREKALKIDLNYM